MFSILWPIWIGILLNVACSTVNLRCIGHYGRVATGWMTYSKWLLGGAWIVLLGLSITNGIHAWMPT